MMSNLITLEVGNTPIGGLLVTACECGLCRIDLPGMQALSGASQEVENKTSTAWSIASQAVKEILEYLKGNRQSFDVPINWTNMGPFQKRVLETTYEIAFGEIHTYGEIASSLGNSNASRAVGAALGKNPMPIIIPCHRVVAANGNLTGFSAADGIRTKAWLLELEGHHIDRQKLA